MITDSQTSILKLFTSFLRLGLTAFGEPSMIAYIRKMAVEKTDKQNVKTSIGKYMNAFPKAYMSTL